MKWVLAALCLLALSACEKSDQIGVAEDFRVRDAQFKRGELPGRDPPDAEVMVIPDPDGGVDDVPRITALEAANLVVTQGQGGKKISGRASSSTTAVALTLQGTTSGYWLIPVGAPDPVTKELTWDVTTDFGSDIESGFYELRAVAIDEDGLAGEQVSRRLCIANRIPDNLHACDDKAAPPRAVIALTWDANVDLDLQIIGKDGVIIDAKRPMGKDGSIDRDSNGGCLIDGIRAESMVWNTGMPKGLYGVYVNMFDSCKQSAARFRLQIFTAVTKKSGGEKLVRWYDGGGELLEPTANGGAARGLFVTEFKFQ